MAAALKEAVYAKNDEKQAPARLLFDMIQSAFLDGKVEGNCKNML